MFYEYIFTLIKLRHAELLASSEVARLLEKTKDKLLTNAEQIRLQADKKKTRLKHNYTIAHGQGDSLLKTPQTDQLISAAKYEAITAEALEDVIFFKKSIF